MSARRQRPRSTHDQQEQHGGNRPGRQSARGALSHHRAECRHFRQQSHDLSDTPDFSANLSIVTATFPVNGGAAAPAMLVDGSALSLATGVVLPPGASDTYDIVVIRRRQRRSAGRLRRSRPEQPHAGHRTVQLRHTDCEWSVQLTPTPVRPSATARFSSTRMSPRPSPTPMAEVTVGLHHHRRQHWCARRELHPQRHLPVQR